MTKHEKIMKRLKEDYDLLESKGYEVFCVSLIGSQNYLLDTEESDIDTKAMIIPNFNNVVLGKKMKSFKIELPSTEQIDVKDFRLMFQNLLKMNINYLEILFTDYYIVNPKYQNQYNQLMSLRESITRYDIKRAINAIAGMSMEKFKALDHPYPSKIHLIEKYGCDSKQFLHIIRLNTFIKEYLKGASYKECLLSSVKDREFLLRIKRYQSYTCGDMMWMAKAYCDETYKIKTKYIEENELVIDEQIKENLDKLIVNILKINFKGEVYK